MAEVTVRDDEAERAAVAAPALPSPRLRTRVRHLLLRGASRFAPAGCDPLPDLGDLRRILLVYVNFRLGNTILATPAVAALCRALPEARIDFAGGPAGPAVFAGYRLGRIHVVRRHDYWNPLRIVRVIRGLRRGRYDAAIHVGTTSSGIGAYTCRVSGAPVRIGCRASGHNVYFTSTLPLPPYELHKVDRLNRYVGSMGIEADQPRRMILGPEEQGVAQAFLASRGAGRPRVAVFLSGRARKAKAWDPASMGAIVTRLRADGVRPVVILGPEERRRRRAFTACLGDAVYVEGRGIREVAAIVQQCDAALAPDSGPMHLAIAVGTPTVGLFRNVDHWKWGPQPSEGRVVYDPEGREVSAVLEANRALLDRG